MTYYFAGASTRSLEDICATLQEVYDLPPFVTGTFELWDMDSLSWRIFNYAPVELESMHRKERRRYIRGPLQTRDWSFGYVEDGSRTVRVTKSKRIGEPQHWMSGCPAEANCQIAVRGIDDVALLSEKLADALQAPVVHYASERRLWTVDKELEVPYRKIHQTGGNYFACFRLHFSPDLSCGTPRFRDEMDYGRAEWSEYDYCDAARHYADGVRDGVERFAQIYAQSGRPIGHVNVTLKDLRFHDVDSARRHFRDSAFEVMDHVFEQHGLAISP